MMSPVLRTFATALLTLVAACQAPLDHVADYDYRQKHPLVVEPRTAVLELANPEDGRLPGFAAEYIRRGRGPLNISVGAVSSNDGAARALAQAVAAKLMAEGLKPAELRLQLVLDQPGIVPGTALLGFGSSVIRLPECYDWSEGQANGPAPNYACNMQRNIGAMVADPRDMLGEQDGSPMPANRASDVVDKYGQGKETWSVPLPIKADTSTAGGGQ